MLHQGYDQLKNLAYILRDKQITLGVDLGAEVRLQCGSMRYQQPRVGFTEQVESDQARVHNARVHLEFRFQHPHYETVHQLLARFDGRTTGRGVVRIKKLELKRME